MIPWRLHSGNHKGPAKLLRPHPAWHLPLPPAVPAWLSSGHRTSARGPEPHRAPMLARNCLLLFLWIVVDRCSVVSLRAPPASLGRSRTALEHVHSLGGPARNGPSGFQRVKRGWVWNQFFVLEEYMGSEPQYVGKVKSLELTQTHSLDFHSLPHWLS